jgi:hypothetical protein
MLRVIFGLLLRIAVVGVVAVWLAAQAAAREWKFGPFKGFEAEVESYDGKRVRLNAGGTVFNIEVEKLSAEDQAYLKKTYPNGKVREQKPRATPAEAESKNAAESAPAAEAAPAEPTAATEAPPAETPSADAPQGQLAPVRAWKGAGTKLQIWAALDSYDGKTAWLAAGGYADNLIKVPVEKLSEEDRAYLKKTYPNGRQGAGIAKEQAAKTQPKRPTAPTDAPKAKPSATVAARPVLPAPVSKDGQDVLLEIVSLTVTKLAADGVALEGLVPGTHATFLVSSPAKKLLRLDAEKSKIECADDRAALLNTPASGSEAPAGGMTLELAPDGQTGTLVLDFPRPPTPKATRIRLKGELHLVCGSDEAPAPVVVPLEVILSLGL